MFFHELALGHAEEAGQLRDVALDQLDFSDAAAFGALPAIDGVLDVVGGLAKLALDEGMRLDPFAEAQVFFALILAEAADLNEVGNHSIFSVQADGTI